MNYPKELNKISVNDEIEVSENLTTFYQRNVLKL